MCIYLIIEYYSINKCLFIHLFFYYQIFKCNSFFVLLDLLIAKQYGIIFSVLRRRFDFELFNRMPIFGCGKRLQRVAIDLRGETCLLGEQISNMKELIENNKTVVMDVTNEMRNRLNDPSFHSNTNYRWELRRALMRTCQPPVKPEAEDELADSKEDSPTADRTARLQEEQNLIHSMYLSMHPETLTAGCDVDVLLEGFTFSCHKLILLSRSDFFAHRFSLPYGGKCRKK